MESIWTRSEWTLADLDGQSVEFRVSVDHGLLEGRGKFLVCENPETHFLAIDILIDLLTEVGKWDQYRLHVPQSGVDRIEEHPDQSVSRFRLVV